MIEPATIDDAAEILSLQKMAFQAVGEYYQNFDIPPLTQTLSQFCADFERHTILKFTQDGEIVGSVRGISQSDGTCRVARLVVHPVRQGQGIGTQLMHAIEATFSGASRFEIFTGTKSFRTIALYERLGYQTYKTEFFGNEDVVFMEKMNVKEIVK